MSKIVTKRGISRTITIVLLALIASVLWLRGYDFYMMSTGDRLDHPEFHTLRSSGTVGYGYGIAGTFLIFTNLLYLARRRLAKWQFGTMKTWLDLHVFTGLTGAVFISFHSAFRTRSTMAQATSLSLLLVIITGLVGRFLYALIPRGENKKLSQQLLQLETILPGASLEIQTILAKTLPPKPGRVPLLRLPSLLFEFRNKATAASDLVAQTITNHPNYVSTNKHLTQVQVSIQREVRKQVRGVGAAAILRTWRGLHLFFAIVMLLTVVFHIGVAWYYGYRWIWSE